MKIKVIALIGAVMVLLSACVDQCSEIKMNNRNKTEQKQYSDPLKFQRAYHHERQVFPYPVQPRIMLGYDPVLKVKHRPFPVKK